MPNPIKYTTGSETNALKKGNFYIGTGDVGKGPSDTTGFYQGVSPSSGGYVIYMNKSGAPGSLSYHNAPTDAELISFTNNLAGQSYTTVNECLTYYAGQSDKVCVNRDYEGIVTDGLILNLDAGFTPSYPKNGTTWYDISLSGNNGTLTNGPTFNSADGGSIVFDGTNDYVDLTNLGLPTSSFTCQCVFKYDNTQNGNSLINLNYSYPNSGYLIRQNNGPIIVFTNNGSETNILSNTSISTNTIYHLVVVQNNGVCSIYLNGILDKQSSLSNPILNSNKDTYLGRRGEPQIGSYLNGRIYTTQIYSRVLSADEVLQNFNAQKGRFGL